MSITVNGEKIEDSQIQQEAERLRPEYEKAFKDMNPKERETQLLEWSKDNLIERALFRQELNKTNTGITNERLDAILDKLKSEYKEPQDFYKKYNAENDEQIKENIKLVTQTQIKIAEINKDITKPTQAEIREYYHTHKEHFQTGEQIRVAFIDRVIDWQTDEQTAYQSINKIYDEFKKGVPFEVLLNKYAVGKNRIISTSRGEDAEEIEDVIFNLGVGQVSNIFRSRYGFHIAKVYEKKSSAAVDFNRVKEQISEILIRLNQEEAFNNYLDRLKDRAIIEEI